jgi:hypothetical protein
MVSSSSKKVSENLQVPAPLKFKKRSNTIGHMHEPDILEVTEDAREKTTLNKDLTTDFVNTFTKTE